MSLAALKVETLHLSGLRDRTKPLPAITGAAQDSLPRLAP